MITHISPDRRFLTAPELLGSGLTHYAINKLVASGKLIKRTKSVYENTEYTGDASDFAVAAAYAPKGILCMMTAARYYGLTTYLPDAIDIAIERSMKVSKLPEWPSIRIWYFPTARYEMGQTSISDESGQYRIYDQAKTVADILYYRNKVGIEETKEILKNYLDKEDRNLMQLHHYAEELGCGKILRTYLEVLL